MAPAASEKLAGISKFHRRRMQSDINGVRVPAHLMRHLIGHLMKRVADRQLVFVLSAAPYSQPQEDLYSSEAAT